MTTSCPSYVKCWSRICSDLSPICFSPSFRWPVRLSICKWDSSVVNVIDPVTGDAKPDFGQFQVRHRHIALFDHGTVIITLIAGIMDSYRGSRWKINCLPGLCGRDVDRIFNRIACHAFDPCFPDGSSADRRDVFADVALGMLAKRPRNSTSLSSVFRLKLILGSRSLPVFAGLCRGVPVAFSINVSNT